MKELLKRLVQCETTACKGELAAARIIAEEFACSGVDSRIESWDQNRANVIVRVNSARRKAGLLFVCHLDVVEPGQAKWRHPPFSAVESDGKIYGRGSTDMKGGIAAIVTAVRQIVACSAKRYAGSQSRDAGTKLQGDIILLCAAGEETDSCGTKRFINDCAWLGELAGVVIPEPTDFAVVTAHRGMIWLKVVTKGKAAHSSQPELGINAISSMKALLDELESCKPFDYAQEGIDVQPHPLLGSCSISVNTISGGKAMNVVPDECTIGIDIRTLPGQNPRLIIGDFEKIFARLRQRYPAFDAGVCVDRAVEAVQTDPNCAFVRDFCIAVGADKTTAVGFTTDAPHLTPLGAPIVIFGPGKSDLCHKPDEYIDIADVEKAVEHYKKIISKFLF